MARKRRNDFKKINTLILAIIFIFFGVKVFLTDENNLQGPYKVVRVVDGDTIIVDLNGAEERVRLIGIDTPESVHPDKEKNVEYGQIASAFTKDMLEGKQVHLEFDVQERDQYGRLLAYVYLNGEMFNKILLEQGHATVVTYPPMSNMSMNLRKFSKKPGTKRKEYGQKTN